MDPIFVYDTTLRDGTQGENISFSAEEKLKIALRLDDIGIHYIEGGWPGSNPKDLRFFELAKTVRFKNARLAAFGCTRRPGVPADADDKLQALIECGAGVVAIFGKSWDLHVTQVMENSLEENLAMIRDTVACLRRNGREVVYDAEHFFDGFKHNRDYALQTLTAAAEGGADFVVLCDTNGGSLPCDIEAVFAEVRRALSPGAARHPHPQRLRAGPGQFDCGRGCRRRHGARNDQRLRRALRQRRSYRRDPCPGT